ncbi:hypothetical protein CEUSTIGMA_g4508.t1 [Chlamydomonas eustigma]|uniref:Uncharacterized protein n=1 Tax=Chlamydomonas eustigma TaxID=1157962 RepID=A0A250X2E2_9CHLO|nr:hypothetical protein CEUSTIGMA_g4508.t1 [Chlamydomonas eustigma]|eukprot:GAX77062.1 hypothetical protein CEUSTIGMA_g4508.t1 [Chlamydomonas eustigma]
MPQVKSRDVISSTSLQTTGRICRQNVRREQYGQRNVHRLCIDLIYRNYRQSPTDAIVSARGTTAVAASTVVLGALGSAAWWPLNPSTATMVSQLMTSSGLLVLAIAVAVFLLASLPTVWALGKAAQRADAVLKVLEQELPESAALLRLSGLEMTECLNEVSTLGTELSCGVRSTAKMVSSVEQGVRQSVESMDRVINQGLLPMAARTESAARSVLEAELRERAQLTHTKHMLSQASQAAAQLKGSVRHARKGLQVVGILGAMVRSGSGALRSARSNLHSHQEEAGANTKKNGGSTRTS